MGVQALGYVIIDSPDPAAWDAFLVDVVGLMRSEGEGEGVYYALDRRRFRFWVRPAAAERVTAAYQVESPADFERLQGVAQEAGRPVEIGRQGDAQARDVDALFGTTDPSGNRLEFFVGDSAPDVDFVSPAGVSEFITGDMGMGHAVFAAPPPGFNATHEFYLALGFRNTDFPHFKFSDDPEDPGMRFAFMHAANGRHHSLAIGEMPGPPAGCVHLMLEMKTMVDVGRCHDRMRAAGIPESATIGRHVNDQTFGFYMQTPGGYDLEIGCDPLVIDPATWVPTAHLQPSEWGHEWAWQKAQREAAKETAR
ncbi:VOC family protein [Parafrankia sp. BMG5.11]|uniref:VOC family protein n=1 Tax=Parafrankia sp. BMG5.11 TaxID=222540 RepID=UPI00103BB838|nr:VOC family protein [Parafrankia sp. BMG5.11]TCJ37038.1 glyoxalase [Parafrankia sp. BMG5.11]